LIVTGVQTCALPICGPPTTYVGHPLIERLAEFRPRQGERGAPDGMPLRLLVLPGSRRSEVGRLMEPFGAALALLEARSPRPFERSEERRVGKECRSG